MSFRFLLQQRDLYAQHEASGQGPHGCAVIHPGVKSTPFSWITPLLRCQAPEGAAEERAGRGRTLRSRMLKGCSRVQSREREGGALRAAQAGLVEYGTASRRGAGRRTRSG